MTVVYLIQLVPVQLIIPLMGTFHLNVNSVTRMELIPQLILPLLFNRWIVEMVIKTQHLLIDYMFSDDALLILGNKNMLEL